MAREIVRTPIEPARRPRRRLEERVLLRLPALARWGASFALRFGPHSRVRRDTLIWAQRAAWEATNRGDWAFQFLAFDPQYEFTFEGDDLRSMFPDIGKRHVGHAGTRALLEEWRSGFEAMRFEPRELLDPGGEVVGAEVEQIGRAGGGIEVRRPIWALYRIQDGLVVRQKVYFDEKLALEELRRA